MSKIESINLPETVCVMMEFKAKMIKAFKNLRCFLLALAADIAFTIRETSRKKEKQNEKLGLR